MSRNVGISSLLGAWAQAVVSPGAQIEFGRSRVTCRQMLKFRPALAAIEHLEDVLYHETARMAFHSFAERDDAMASLSAPITVAHADRTLCPRSCSEESVRGLQVTTNAS